MLGRYFETSRSTSRLVFREIEKRTSKHPSHLELKCLLLSSLAHPPPPLRRRDILAPQSLFVHVPCPFRVLVTSLRLFIEAAQLRHNCNANQKDAAALRPYQNKKGREGRRDPRSGARTLGTQTARTRHAPGTTDNTRQ